MQGDLISRDAVIEQTYLWSKDEFLRITNPFDYLRKRIKNLPPVDPQEKIGRWTLTQRGKYIDISCSECGNVRLKDYAYGYTIDEIDLDEVNELIVKNHLNYCEYCGAKMINLQERNEKE